MLTVLSYRRDNRHRILLIVAGGKRVFADVVEVRRGGPEVRRQGIVVHVERDVDVSLRVRFDPFRTALSDIPLDGRDVPGDFDFLGYLVHSEQRGRRIAQRELRLILQRAPP
ncbi:hypothetical protein M0R88_15610 [Halorussus gelatinilyticus]|uniref:Uncharacterized protein n=1 Tax=Halorussus gelatinilyticus TaxID=2937524 RepID=A0A8U0IFS3_9EURY|nr:hypothetical protein [Halorussus gelatinilyticus]UPV99929.1 hypothetical protein M0R88_15610 [Halorussus gelatinilyticus]